MRFQLHVVYDLVSNKTLFTGHEDACKVQKAKLTTTTNFLRIYPVINKTAKKLDDLFLTHDSSKSKLSMAC